MQFIQGLRFLFLIAVPFLGKAQSTYLMQGSKDYHFIERLEIKQQTNTHMNFSTIKPYSRKAVVEEVQFLDSARTGFIDTLTGEDKFKEWTDLNLSPVDEYNLDRFLMNNSEWAKNANKENWISKKPFLKNFYIKQNNFFEVDKKDFAIVLNPVFQYSQAAETGNLGSSPFINSRGIVTRGHIGQKVGFSAYFVENQERGPNFFKDYTNTRKAVPGANFYKDFRNGAVDYFDARGYITFSATKYIDVQLGHDRHHWGNGYRSLYLSDWGANMAFLKLNTKFWKINYTNLFTELTRQHDGFRDKLLPKKFAAFHHLSMNVNKWLNVGLFEGVVFSRNKQYELQYLNPLIFYRHVEGSLGSPDNAVMGLDYKANIAHRGQIYGQFLLDEFVLKNFRERKGWWGNKYGIQLGVKYMDALGINNLDMQLETNWVRPFTYSRDSATNYTHYNMPLAHPLGANFRELIYIARYQPAPKWYIDAKLIYYTKGLDSSGKYFGGDIFRNSTFQISANNREFGYYIANGRKSNALITTFNISHEWRENVFFDIGIFGRFNKIKNAGQSNTLVINLGVRANIFKRQYDF